MVLVCVYVTIVWRKWVVPPAPQDGLMGETFSKRDGTSQEERVSLLLANSLHIQKVRELML